jgi:hypothetical protein
MLSDQLGPWSSERMSATFNPSPLGSMEEPRTSPNTLTSSPHKYSYSPKCVEGEFSEVGLG